VTTQAPINSKTELVIVPASERKRRWRGRRGGALQLGHWWWALPGVVLVFAVHYVATAIGGFFAFTDWTGIGAFNLIGWANFEKIFADPSKVLALGNTLFLAFSAVVISNIAGVALAFGLNRTLRTRYALRALFFMPVVMSPLATSYIWKFIFDYNGPLNVVLRSVGLEELARPWVADPTFAIWTVLVVVAWQNTGIAMVIYIAGLTSIPMEIEEASALDGAGLWKRFWFIQLPSIRPAVAIATTLGLINSLRIFDQIMALTAGGPAGASETLATQVYKQTFALGNFGYGAALALVLTVIILIFAVIQQRVTNPNKES
jgi:raffinose/stachyose/melibiose transport system permease protein